LVSDIINVRRNLNSIKLEESEKDDISSGAKNHLGSKLPVS